MAEFPSLPLWTDAYLADTRHLSTLEHGAYLLLLMEAWRRPTCSLPDDDALLARLAGVQEQEWFKIKGIVLDFWDYDGRRKEWRQLRLVKERDFLTKQRASQRDRAVSGWNKRKKTHAQTMPDSMPDECPEDAHTPTPTYKENNSNELSKKKGKIGTRLPEDWSLSEPLTEWIRSKKYSRNFVLREIEKFKNFWAAKAGKDGIKLDWDATARNWLLRAAERETKNTKQTIAGAAAQALEEMENAEFIFDTVEPKQGDTIGRDKANATNGRLALPKLPEWRP